MKILFVDTIYGTPKGHSYVNKDLIKILKEEQYEVGMCKVYPNRLLEDFPEIEIVSEYADGIETPKEIFLDALERFQPDICFFNEYNQWIDVSYDKLDICKEKGIMTVGYLVHERLDWSKKEHYKKYGKIICPTGWQTKLLRKNGLYNSYHTPWGVDFKEINKAISNVERNNDKIVFFHCAGSGGVNNRKNTEYIIEAYNKIKDETTELQISHLGKKVFSRNDILLLTARASVLLNPAKHDTIGINSIESCACGTPVIVLNIDPVNELINNNVNGLLVEGEKCESIGVTCDQFVPDVEDLANKMNICKNKFILETLQRNALVVAKENFDWDKNKGYILKVFRK